MYPKFLIATTFLGVRQVSAINFTIDYPDLAPLKSKYFLENLSTLSDGERLATIIDYDDADVYQQIEDEYGIN